MLSIANEFRFDLICKWNFIFDFFYWWNVNFRLLSSLSLSLVRVLWSPFLQLTNNLINLIFRVFECRKNNSIQSVEYWVCLVCVFVCSVWLVLWAANLKEAQRIRSQNRSEAAAGSRKPAYFKCCVGWWFGGRSGYRYRDSPPISGRRI